jgi:hypothetical protein
VRERMRAAGVEVEEGEGDGFIVRDPWDIAAVFTRNSRRGGRAEVLGRRPYRRCASGEAHRPCPVRLRPS